ncbi:MAG: 30S ribosomal protein S17e [Candidatus Woesearchaeota archaeon]
MGRIKTMLIKRNTNELVEKTGTSFGKDFEHNKKEVVNHANFGSKKIRNIVAGYVTRLTKNRN